MTSSRASLPSSLSALLIALAAHGCGQDAQGGGSGGTSGAAGSGGCGGDGCELDSGVDGAEDGDGWADAPTSDDPRSRDDAETGDAADSEAGDEATFDGRDDRTGNEADAGEPVDAGDEADGFGAQDGGDALSDADLPDASASCGDGTKNGAETDLDCGGPSCPPCEASRACVLPRDCKTATCVDAVCRLATAPPYWLTAVPMTASRANLAAAMIPTGVKKGKLIAIGGGDAPSSYETFDTLGTAWVREDSPTFGADTATAGTDGKVYVFAQSSRDTWVFDGAWKSFTQRPNHLGAGGFIAAAGGSNGLIYLGGTYNITTYIDVYSPLLDQWSILAAPKPHQAYGQPLLASLGSKIDVIGGDSIRPRALEAYDVITASWSSLADIPTPPSVRAVAVGGDGRIYVPGGTRGAALGEVLAYDPSMDRWDPVASLLTARSYHTAVAGPDGRIYVLGGSPGQGNLKSVEVYGPVAALTKSEAAVGTSVLVTGNNFAANANVAAYFGAVQGPPIATGKTNGTGGIATTIAFKVPNVPPGETFVSVIDDRSRFTTTIPFTVTAP